jgi:type 1 glutamine amidotransferase
MPLSLASISTRATLLGAALLLAGSPMPAQTPAASGPSGTCSVGNAPRGSRVLVFSRTKGFRHGSIPTGVAAITELGTSHGFAVDATEDPSVFTDEGLRRYGAVVFMSTTGDVLDSLQQASFERFIQRGGGFVGVHSATDTEYDWPWYGQLVGAYFKTHPRVQEAKVNVVDRKFIATKCLPAVWTRTDEWYDFRAPPAKDVTILATIDESSYQGGGMGAFHPMSWYHKVGNGRAFYTELGHTNESFQDPLYRSHLTGGIIWALTR